MTPSYLSLDVINSSVFPLWVWYPMAQAASSYIVVYISYSHIDEDIYPSLVLSSTSSLTFQFSFSSPFSVFLLIFYSFQFIFTVMSGANHTIEIMSIRLLLIVFVDVFPSDDFCDKRTDLFKLSPIPFLELLRHSPSAPGLDILRVTENETVKRQNPPSK